MSKMYTKWEVLQYILDRGKFVGDGWELPVKELVKWCSMAHVIVNRLVDDGLLKVYKRDVKMVLLPRKVVDRIHEHGYKSFLDLIPKYSTKFKKDVKIHEIFSSYKGEGT